MEMCSEYFEIFGSNNNFCFIISLFIRLLTSDRIIKLGLSENLIEIGRGDIFLLIPNIFYGIA